MTKLWIKAKKVLADPRLRPFEIWLFRIVIAYLAVKLGIKVGETA